MVLWTLEGPGPFWNWPKLLRGIPLDAHSWLSRPARPQKWPPVSFTTPSPWTASQWGWLGRPTWDHHWTMGFSWSGSDIMWYLLVVLSCRSLIGFMLGIEQHSSFEPPTRNWKKVHAGCVDFGDIIHVMALAQVWNLLWNDWIAVCASKYVVLCAYGLYRFLHNSTCPWDLIGLYSHGLRKHV